MFFDGNWNVPVPGAAGPSDKIMLYDDFVVYSGSANADISVWFETLGTGAGIADSDAEPGGAIVITSGTAGETGLEPNGTAFSMPATGKTLYAECRFKVADADIADGGFFFGLATPSDVAPVAAATNRIGILKNDADATLFTVLDATETSVSLDMADNDYVTVAFLIANGKITYFVNLEDGVGVRKVGVHESSLPAAGTMLMPKAYVNLSAASAQTVTIDYIRVQQDR